MKESLFTLIQNKLHEIQRKVAMKPRGYPKMPLDEHSQWSPASIHQLQGEDSGGGVTLLPLG